MAAGETIETFVTLLRRIQMEGGERNFVKFTSVSHPDCWMRFLSTRGDDGVDAEISSHKSRGETCILNQGQVSRLQSLGWQPPRPYGIWRYRFDNFYHQWPVVSTDADRQKIVRQAMQTFKDVYGMALDASLPDRIMASGRSSTARRC
jgi:hypothetical protein